MARGGIEGGGGIDDDAAMVVGYVGYAGFAGSDGVGKTGFAGATYGPGIAMGNVFCWIGRLLPLLAASASAKPAQSRSTVTQSQRSSSENVKGSCAFIIDSSQETKTRKDNVKL